MAAILCIAVGIVSTLIGVACWTGRYPTVRRTGWFKGGAHADLIFMGPGLVLIGVAGQIHAVLLGLVGLAIVLAGFVLGLISPSWLLPRWYKERYPDPPRST
jgi:hypothetical protein